MSASAEERERKEGQASARSLFILKLAQGKLSGERRESSLGEVRGRREGKRERGTNNKMNSPVRETMNAIMPTNFIILFLIHNLLLPKGYCDIIIMILAAILSSISIHYSQL